MSPTQQLAGRDVLVRAGWAFHSYALVTAVLNNGVDVSITVRMDSAVERAIAGIGEQAWTTIEYTDAVYDETTSTWEFQGPGGWVTPDFSMRVGVAGQVEDAVRSTSAS